MRTDIVNFKNPHSRRNKLGRVAWGVAWRLLFRPSPWFMNGWRRFLLRAFGAKLGKAHFHPTVEIWAPWFLHAGDAVYVDRDVVLYNTYGLRIGDRVVISRGAFLCTPSHDHTRPDFPLIGGHITVGSDVWIAAEAFISPGVKVGDGAVVGARAVVTKDVAPWTVVAGNPAREISPRRLSTQLQSAPTGKRIEQT